MPEPETSEARVTGLNHITLAVADLDRATAFYRDILGFRLRTKSNANAYLDAGSLWLCLSLDAAARTGPHPDYTHIALSVSDQDFNTLSSRIQQVATIWKDNKSEGSSLYFLDPDRHKLELHAGSLESRLAHYRASPIPDRIFFEN